jgi:phosphoenolpyruvate carboxykinase (ATP)
VNAIQKGDLIDVETEHLDLFNLDIPLEIPGIEGLILNPRDSWDDPAAYDQKAVSLARQFIDNFSRFDVQESIILAGPQLASE